MLYRISFTVLGLFQVYSTVMQCFIYIDGTLELWSKSTKCYGDGAEQNGNLQQGGERPGQGALCPFVPKGSETT